MVSVLIKDEDPGPHREKAALYKPRREASGEINPADTLISDLQPPGL